MIITPHQVELWLSLAAMAVGALALAMLILGAAAGSAWRLFMICSGRAVVVRKRRKPPRPVRVPLSTLLDGGAGKDTEDLPVVTLDG